MNTTPETAVAVTPPIPQPKPRRSRRRWYLLGGFALLFIAAPVAFYFLSAWWRDSEMEALYAELDAEDPNWRWHDLLAEFKQPPDDQNSAVQVQKVLKLLNSKAFNPGPKWDNNASDFKRNARLAADYEQLLRESFALLEPTTVAEARKLSEMPHGGFAIEPVDVPYFHLKLDFMQETRKVINLLMCDTILLAQDGKQEEALDSCRAMLNLSRAIKDQPFLIAQLVRVAEQAISVHAIERTLGQDDKVGDACLQRLQKLLEMEVAGDALRIAMRGERAGGHQMYVQIQEGKVTLSEIMNGAGAVGRAPSLGERMVDMFPGVILSGYPDYLRRMSEQVRASKLKDSERAEAMAKLEADLRGKRASMISRMIMPATVKVNDSSQRVQAHLRSTLAAVAVERYRLKEDAWPRSLDDVVKAGLLKEVPPDPYDGKPLRFKRTPTSVIVYSIGMNKVDDGGTNLRGNPMAPNADYGFELWDPHHRGVTPLPEPEK